MPNKNTKEERQALIEQLQSLDSHKRDHVRKHIKEGDYVRLFGNFSTFKLAAGLSPSKLEKQFNNQVASNVDNYKLNKLNDKKNEYVGKYLRPSNKRFQTIVCASDIHSKLSDQFSIDCFIDTLKRTQCDRVILNGDIVDFECLSSHGGNDPRRFTITDEMKWLDDFLTNIRNILPSAQITFLEGNHENRLLRHFANESPFVRELLSEYHGFDFAKLLGLDKFNINFISKSNLCVYTETSSRKEVDKNYIVFNDMLAYGHTPEVRKHGLPSVWGHCHTYKTFAQYDYRYGSYHNLQTGCMTTLDAHYCEGSHWNNGFLITHLDTHSKRHQHEYINTSNDFCMIGGQFYER
jgi:hypothetical protein